MSYLAVYYLIYKYLDIFQMLLLITSLILKWSEYILCFISFLKIGCGLFYGQNIICLSECYIVKVNIDLVNWEGIL